MGFYQQLVNATTQNRDYLLTSPLITDTFNKRITLDQYVEFLTQAYHHVKHTVPLLMAAGSRIPENKEWLRDAVAEYIEEELGHQEWILNDINACGANKESVRHGTPNPATELLIAYAYDTIHRINPIGFFGMVLVLEGTSIELAIDAAGAIQQQLGLPDQAFSYLRSHGTLDQEHMKFFEKLMNRIEDHKEQALIIHGANMFYKLYADIFRSIPSDKFN